MKRSAYWNRLLLVVLATGLFAGGLFAGRWWADREAASPAGGASPRTSAGHNASSAGPAPERRVLYWYDPMSPSTRFDKPGKSPFMDMDLIPKYADEDADAGSVRIDPSITQNLGMRLATVTKTALGSSVLATGVVTFNDRDVAVVQARASGFVERVAALAPGDVLAAGSFVAELLVPEWAAPQHEYLTLRAMGQSELADASLQRLRLAGAPESLVADLVRSGEARTRIVITAPRSGVVQELGVRAGMTVTVGQTLVKLNGIGSVWIDVAVPESQAGQLRRGQAAEVRLASEPSEVLKGKVTTLLPALNEAARTLRVRIELANPGGRMRPGLTAQVRIADERDAGALVVPTEAVIRTGQRAIVMVADGEGRFRPVEVELGGEIGAQTTIRSGLSEGQQVVASGQFLIDSEASLRGITASRGTALAPLTRAQPALHRAEATVDAIDADEVTLTHGPFESLKMPGMTMVFPLANEHVTHGIKAGDRVVVEARQDPKRGLIVERLTKSGGR